MEQMKLYQVERADGGIDVTPHKPDDGVVYAQKYRLIAQDGMLITDGIKNTPCIDVDNPEGWYEIKDEFKEFLERYEINEV